MCRDYNREKYRCAGTKIQVGTVSATFADACVRTGAWNGVVRLLPEAQGCPLLREAVGRGHAAWARELLRGGVNPSPGNPLHFSNFSARTPVFLQF